MNSIQYDYKAKGMVRLDNAAKRYLCLSLYSQTPLFDDVRDIVISKQMAVALVLVSFEQVRPRCSS